MPAMVEPTDDTQPGLGPVKKKLNKKVVVGAALAGALAAAGVLWPQYAPLIDQLRKLVGF
jgi:hypothetical protein